MTQKKQIPKDPKKLEQFLLEEIRLAGKEYFIFDNFPYDVKKIFSESKLSELILFSGDEIEDKLKQNLDFVNEQNVPGQLENCFSIFQNVFPPNTTNRGDAVLSRIEEWRNMFYPKSL